MPIADGDAAERLSAALSVMQNPWLMTEMAIEFPVRDEILPMPG